MLVIYCPHNEEHKTNHQRYLRYTPEYNATPCPKHHGLGVDIIIHQVKFNLQQLGQMVHKNIGCQYLSVVDFHLVQGASSKELSDAW